MNGRGMVANLGPKAETGSINRTIASTTGRIGLLAASFAGGAVAVWVAVWQKMEP